MTRITDLPGDVIVIILSQLDLRDLLAFQSTCRGAYALVEEDLLWHQLIPTSHLPLPIPLSSALQSSVPTLRDILAKAQKLEENMMSSDIIGHKRPLITLGTMKMLETRAARLVSPDRELIWTTSHDVLGNETAFVIWNVHTASEPKMQLCINFSGRLSVTSTSYIGNRGVVVTTISTGKYVLNYLSRCSFLQSCLQ
jgi:hypothetical protein